MLIYIVYCDTGRMDNCDCFAVVTDEKRAKELSKEYNTWYDTCRLDVEYPKSIGSQSWNTIGPYRRKNY